MVYAVIGIACLVGGFKVVDMIIPHDLWAEIVGKHNQALATVVAGFAIAVALIIAAVVH
jgi:uncharacterized membrane protein YjfL (UPF0719 family)